MALFISFCPHGTQCAKGGRRLGADPDEPTARWRIANHLHTSNYHKLIWEEATRAAQDAHDCVEVQEEAAESRNGAEDKRSHSSSRSRRSRSRRSRSRSGPTHRSALQIRADTVRRTGQVQSMSGIIGTGEGGPTITRGRNRFLENIRSAEAAARSGARSLRFAAANLEAEADELHQCYRTAQQN